MRRSPPSAALRRVAVTLVVYLGVAALLWWGVPAFQRLLLLPPLFGRIARGALLLGAPVAALLAWRFPELGDPGPEDDGSQAAPSVRASGPRGSS
jgi:hypothetical protein